MNYVDAGIDLIKKIKKIGYDAYFVGGFVRDYLLNLAPNDIDITTNASCDVLKKIFSNVCDKGIKYQSVVIENYGFSFEVTTFRVESNYDDFRHPIVKTTNSLNDDLKRRDFTINALAMDENYKIIDLFSGLNDLKNGIIRAVLDPVMKFTEDALRMLRACYFRAKLGFDIEEKTFNAIKEKASLVKYLNSDCVYKELKKIICSKYSLLGLKALNDSSVSNYIPGLSRGIDSYLRFNINLNDMSLFLALCFKDNLDELSYYKISKAQRKEIINIIKLIYILANNFEPYNLINYTKDEIIKANVLGSNIKLFKNNEAKLIEIYESAIYLRDNLAISFNQIKTICSSIEKTKKIYEAVLRNVINGKLENNIDKINNFIAKEGK